MEAAVVTARIRVAVDDPLVAKRLGLDAENIQIEGEPFFLDGPVSARVAVVDRDPATGALAPSVPWILKKTIGEYDCPDDITERESVAASVFGLVLRTLSIFEREEVLARPLSWHFGPQLLVVPRAGVWENAFYDRYSRSIQFFFFDTDKGHTVRTALSRDIVAHETGHAVLDAVAPALYDAVTPQTLALHESIGDLAAICMTLDSPTMRNWILRTRNGALTGDSPASKIADEFGEAFKEHHPLRNANNKMTVKKAGDDPHDLSEVLTGAVWKAMVRFHGAALDQARAKKSASEPMRARALGISARQIARILFRALDFMPPAETTFADYLRAVLRSDTLAREDDRTGYREVLMDEAVKRGIVTSRKQLDTVPNEDWLRTDLDELVESDWTAYDFVHRNRKLLGIPPGTPYRLFPRRDVQRKYFTGQGGGTALQREVMLHVTWEELEPTDIPGLPSRTATFKGTTLVLGGEQDEQGRHSVLSCLTTDSSPQQQGARRRTLRRLLDEGRLQFSHDGTKPSDVRPLAPIVSGRVANDTLRLRGTARLLHLAGRRPA